MSDASAEAERLITALRTRGYQVVDVPLGLLVSRVSVQRPSLILCDADAPGAVESIERIHRDVPGGHRVDVVFMRERTAQANPELTAIIEREGSGSFERPIDDNSLARKVEALVGPPTRHAHRPRLAAGGRAPILVAATRRPFRFEQRASPSLLPEPLASGQAAGPQSVAVAPSRAAPESAPTSSPTSAPDASGSPRDTPPSLAPGAAHVPLPRLSPELEMLLGRAEQRFAQGRAGSPASDRLSPEAELDAILPEEVLAALDEPLDVEDDDESDAGPSTHGGERAQTRGGSKTTGHGGTGAADTPEQADPTNAGQPQAPHLPTDPPPSDDPDEGPKTPPAMPGRGLARATSEPDPLPNAAEPHAAAARSETEEPPPRSHPFVASTPPAQISTTPPRGPRSEPEEHAAPLQPSQELVLPASLRAGDALRCLALAVRSRYTGAVAFESPDGIRRVAFRDGDFVTVATSLDSESLIACLIERGSIPTDTGGKLGRKLPLFGRHAGAALIAHGYLQQDELWPVLRTHAEWLIGHITRLEQGEAGVEREVPLRLASEPAVFGGATGAEVFMEVVRRVTQPDIAVARLRGPSIRLRPGPRKGLLDECALPPQEAEVVRSLDGDDLGTTLSRVAALDFAAALLALVELGILETSEAAPAPGPSPLATRSLPDKLDAAALRSRIAARRALVDEGDYFTLLGVGRSATSYDVRRAYAELREELDPSRSLTPATADLRDDVDAILAVLAEAHEILADDVRRERYLRALEAAPR